MKVNGEMKWMSLTYTASSLHHIINLGHLHYTLRSQKLQWLSLISGSQLQDQCYNQGFSIEMKSKSKSNSYLNVRLGFVADNDYQCSSPNSCIGFGISTSCNGYPQTDTTCGNVDTCGELNNLNISAFGYILVQ